MDIGRALTQGLGEQRIDQSDNRRVVLALQQILDLGDLLQQTCKIQIIGEVAGQRGGAPLGAAVQGRHQFVEFITADPVSLQRYSQNPAQFGQRTRTGTIANRHLGYIGAESSYNDPVGLGESVRDFVRGPGSHGSGF